MSRFAKKPIELPNDVKAEMLGSKISITGKLGTMSLVIMEDISVTIKDTAITVISKDEAKPAGPMLGTTIALIKNYIEGTSKGFKKTLQLHGVGYRAQMQNNVLVLTLGLSHPVEIKTPSGVTFETPSQTEIIISSFDKQLVGQVAASIRAIRPPEPYKGKGVKYSDEVILKKEVKKK